MRLKSLTVRITCRRVPLLTIILALASVVSAQTPRPASTPAPQPSPTPSLERRFVKNILHDQVAIFTSPLHLSRHDTNWLLPLGLATGALITTDPNTERALDFNQSRLNASRDVSYLGSGYTTGGIAAAFYLIGRATHNARARETGLLGAEALIDSGILAQVLKVATQRPRPLQGEQKTGEFFAGGNSFPSGHATAAWTLAEVIAEEYKSHRLVRFGVYGLAAAVSVARYTGENHFLGDVLVGSAIGYGIGRYVYRTHHDRSLDDHYEKRPRGRLIPLISPHYTGRARGSGVTLAWNL